MAMNRYRANEALDMANKFAVVVYSGYHTATAMGNTWSSGKVTLESSGLIASGGSTTPGGATIEDKSTESDLQDGKVKLDITFPTEEVCKAAASILGKTEACTDAKMTGVEFKQS